MRAAAAFHGGALRCKEVFAFQTLYAFQISRCVLASSREIFLCLLYYMLSWCETTLLFLAFLAFFPDSFFAFFALQKKGNA